MSFIDPWQLNFSKFYSTFHYSGYVNPRRGGNSREIIEKNINLQKFLFFASILLAVGFVIRFAADVYLISVGHNSAPAWLFLIVRAIVFLVPAAICFVVSMVLKKKAETLEEK